jgi:hypothetical protein
MTFREDPEGPQDRADRLDEELHDAHRVLHEAREKRLAHLEYEIAHTQEHLGKMQQTLRQLRDEPPTGRPPPAALSSGVSGFAKILPVLLPVGMIAMMGFALGHSSARRNAVRVAQRAAMAKQASVFQAGTLGTISQGGLIGEVRGASTGNVSLTWTARVKRATGVSIPVGTTCTLSGDLASDGAQLTGADVSLTCGDKVVYRKGDYNGISALMSVDEFPAAGGGFGYNLHLEDTTRPSYDRRTQASIDTEARLITVWRDTGTPFKIELDLDEALARSHAQASPLYPATARAVAVGARVTRTGKVVSANGASSVSPGARCTVQIAPATQASGWSCRAFVRCGGKSLYGEQGSGYTECTGQAASLRARDVGFTMDDGDPRLDADFAAGTVNVTDNDVNSWSVSVKLDDEPLGIAPARGLKDQRSRPAPGHRERSLFVGREPARETKAPPGGSAGRGLRYRRRRSRRGAVAIASRKRFLALTPQRWSGAGARRASRGRAGRAGRLRASGTRPCRARCTRSRCRRRCRPR